MSARPLIIPSKFTAIDDLSPALDRIGRSSKSFTQNLEGFSNRSERLFKKLTPGLSSASKQLVQMAGTAALIGGAFQLGRSSVQSIMDYETAMQSLQAVTGVSDAKMVGFKAEIGSLATLSRKSAIDVASSFETIGSNMSEYLDDPKGLRQIAEAGIKLSKASRTELQPTMNDLTSIMNQFDLKASQAANTVERLTAGEIVGSVRTSQLAGYLQQFGGVAKSNNVSLEESVALVEALGKQLPKEAIGTAARNLVTFMSAAGGMDKKALVSMKQYGVDTKLLMNNQVDLGTKLKELSKLKGDAIAMERFFGRENIAAGNIIFQQLGTYEQYHEKILTTNKATEQAALNSNTLANRIDELKNSWSNMLTSSNKSTEGLESLKRAIVYVTDNLGEIVTVGLKVIKFYAEWKALNIGLRVVTTAYNIILGVRNALLLRSEALIAGNTVALKAGVITEKLMVAQIWLFRAAMSAQAVVTAIATGDMWALNAAMAANPVGLLVLGVAALAAGIGFLVLQNKALWEEYEKRSNQNILDSMSSEERAVNSLSERYIKLGYSKEQAFLMSLKYERQENNLDIIRKKGELVKLRAQRAEKEVMFMGGKINLPGHDAIQDKINAKEASLTGLASKNLELTNLAIARTEVDQKRVEKFDMSEMKITAAQTMGSFQSSKVAQAQASETTTTNNNNQNLILTLKNESNSQVDASGFGKNFSFMPQMTSTFSTKK